MKVLLSTKKIFIGIAVILVISVLGASIIYLYFNHGMNTFDKYQSIVDICEQKKQGLNIVSHCKVFIDSVEKKEDETLCFNISVVTKENSLKQEKVCENENIFDWDSSTMISEDKVPVYWEMKYSIFLPATYRLKNISLALMEDSAILDLVRDIYGAGTVITNFRTQKTKDIKKNGYYLYNVDDLTDEKQIGLVYFMNVKVEKVAKEGKAILLTLNLEVKGKKLNALVRTEKFAYSDGSNGGDLKYLSYTDISKIDMNKTYQAMFFYIPSKTSLSLEKISKSYCDGSNKTNPFGIFCNLNIKDIPKVDTGIEEYIQLASTTEESNFDELILGLLDAND